MGPVSPQPRARGDEVGVRAGDPLHGADRAAAVRDGGQGACAGRARGLHQAALEAGRGLDDPLCRRRRDRDHPGRGRDGIARAADVGRLDRGVRGGLRFRPVHLPVAVHEKHDGRQLLGERAQVVHARVHQHERHDGWDGAGDDLADDGSGHARHGADRDALLGCDVGGRHRRLCDRLPRQRLDGVPADEARPDDAARQGS
mmetsp:Transcript_61795/g.146125  ORF Transcript_61795/g.146125 Transcript_61795/m.146125 type:complete len:201 (-) Transcript_61795:930-1532(-)